MLNYLLRRTVKPQWRPGLGIAEIRRHAARTDARLARRIPPCPTEAVSLADVEARWFGAPELATRGVLLYLHGGAWCLHLPGLYHRFAALLSRATGMRVLLVNYRLAPEHCYPAGIEDCFAVYRELQATVPADVPLVIAGDSAGGSLSLVTSMRARDARLRLPTCAVLLSPSTDLTMSGPSIRYNADADPMFSLGAGDLLPDIYCPGLDRSHPLISPLFGNWSGLPPLYFIVGSTETLLDDSVRGHDRARQAGTDARIDVWWEMPHVFPLFTFLPEARVALESIKTFVEEHVGRARRAALARSRVLDAGSKITVTTAEPTPGDAH
jgi:monoterpene epsilon-lactone hydrolase